MINKIESIQNHPCKFVYSKMLYIRNLTQGLRNKPQPPAPSITKSNTKDSDTTDSTSRTPTYEEMIEQIILERTQYLNPMMSISYRAHPVRIKVARGQFFFQENGSKTLDCINNVSHIGHCHPYYVSKMQKQLNKLVTNSRFLYDQILEATRKLLKRFPPELCVVTFTNSGSEANDLAMQMAQIHTKKRGVMCLEGGYHGITRSCIEVSPYKWSEFYHKEDHITVARSPCVYRGFLADSKDPANDYAQYIDGIIDDKTGAFICQFMQSCAGQIIPPKQLYQKVYQKLRSKGVVCIGDEVQTGFGRLGETFWAFEYYGVTPDIVTVGKAMGNGFPVSAVICTKEIAESYRKRDMEFFSTYGGNPLAMTAVISVLDVIEYQNLQENARTTGEYLRQRLKQLLKGVGLFQGIDIVKSKESKAEDGETAAKIILMMRKKGCLVSRDGVHENVLKIKPPIIFNKQNVDQLMSAFAQVLPQIQNSQ